MRERERWIYLLDSSIALKTNTGCARARSREGLYSCKGSVRRRRRLRRQRRRGYPSATAL